MSLIGEQQDVRGGYYRVCAVDPLATGVDLAGWCPGRAAAVIAVAGAALSSLISMALVPALPSVADALEGRLGGALLAQLVIAANTRHLAMLIGTTPGQGL